VYERAWITACEGRPVDAALQTDMRAVAAYATAVALDVTTRAFRYSGGSALYKSNVVQRLLRDMNAGAQHMTVSDAAYELLGQVMLGIPPTAGLV
jgi:alkylation response protein AidB-like acyl-CoA dehydrogenase